MTLNFLHPQFKFCGNTFSSKNELIAYCKDLAVSGNSTEKFEASGFILEWLNDSSHITAHTSGSTGRPKQILLNKENVRNSAQATIEIFELNPGSTALLCMSTQYIGGKMMMARAMVGGWSIDVVPPSKNPLEAVHNSYDFTAMVPYQLFHSIDHLDKAKKIIIGGGIVSTELENRLQKCESTVFATYGMTETISHIAVRAINGSGRSEIYQALPGVRLRQDNDDCLIITAPKISDVPIETNDVVRLISDREFIYLGRLDNVINSGGVKIYPESLEKKLSNKIGIPFFIASEKDPALGERVILIVESTESTSSIEESFNALHPFERPKKIYSLPTFIYTETGKIKRHAILEQLDIK